jgi:hypothetical protein
MITLPQETGQVGLHHQFFLSYQFFFIGSKRQFFGMGQCL